MDENHGFKFVCKLCNKKYPCGKSLGGHMKSHVTANSAESDEKIEKKMKNILYSHDGDSSFIRESKLSEFGYGQTSNGLRENPRKTWRAFGSSLDPLPIERICKLCGKGFQSMKALCGHMACHSDKDRGFKDDQSWTSENLDNEEVEEWSLRTRSSSKSKKSEKNVKSSCFSLVYNGSSQEEVAISLMLLSRDSGNKGGVNSLIESSDNNSIVLENKSSSFDKNGDMKLKGIISGLDDDIAQMENSDSGYFLNECAEVDSDASVDGFHMIRGFGNDYGNRNRIKNYRTSDDEYYDEDNGMTSYFSWSESRKRKYSSGNSDFSNKSSKICDNSQKRSKYECFNCKRTFKSYQALGGHRPCLKKTNFPYESGENCVADASGDSRTCGKLVESASKNKLSAKNLSDKKLKGKKNKAHVCPFCDRVFKNGQALGGHKRSHIIGGHGETLIRNPEVKPDLFDLNLLAPEEHEDDQNGRFFQW